MKRFICVAFFVLSFSSAWALSDAERAVAWTRCWDAVRYYFPGFDDQQAAAWDASFDSNWAELKATGSDTEFWRKLRMIIATLGDGRTALQLPNGLPRTYDTVPIRFVLAGDKILVKQLGESPEVQSSSIRVGDELITVEHRPVIAYMREECLPHVSGSMEKARLAEAAWRLLHGPADSPVHLVLRHPAGQEFSLSLKRNSGPDAKLFRDLTKKKGPMAKKLRGSVIYVDVGQRFTAESEQTIVDQLKENPRAEGVILDLRETKYGYVPMRVLEKLALFPLPMGEYRETDWTTVPKPFDLTLLQEQRQMRDLKSQMIEPTEEPFRGKVVILVSGETEGPAEQFIEPLIFADRVALVGDTTAGAGGQALEIALEGGAKLTVTARQPKWENGCGQGRGFPPKIYAVLSAKGLATGKDDVLDRALAFIRERAD
jgi:C-terminal processing protease CtpA/Prc